MSGACPVCGAVNDPTARFCSTCGTNLQPATTAREFRKTVTVLFADVTGSTALGERLDPETLRALMGRYFTEMKAIIERHGGTVEKFIGDAVMAVFGIPMVHEDDALRAVRAAADIRGRLSELNDDLTASRGIAIRFRTGVNTGEVVAGDPASGHTLVTGDTVNTAARLEQAAPPGEILLGRVTYGLVRDAVEVEQVEPVAAKGKAEPVPAYRLVAVRASMAGHARNLESPLVGREAELAALRAALAVARDERVPRLVTVLGTAGVGKSRLVAELLGAVAGEATVLKGRCLSYGEGITYWPLREIVHAVAGIEETDDAEVARAKVRAALGGATDAELLARRVGVAIGLETEPAPQEELFWAIRKLLEHLARDRPVVAVVEDIHWAEPTLLDLLEYIVDLAADTRLVLLCPARPELLEKRPGWGGGRASSTVLRLEPLETAATEQLIQVLPGGSTLPAGLRRRILAAAEGNPLYLEEMLAMLIDEGHLIEAGGTWQAASDLDDLHVPASVRALLAARIDGLPDAERRVAEHASVVGRVFEAAAVRDLAHGSGADVGQALLGLVRKELVRPERSQLSAGDAFKFRHLLIRDAAYEALPKAERADLHERFAAWLERATADRIGEYEEILGYHLAQAHRYRTELGETGEPVARLAERSAVRYLNAGRRARGVGDVAAAAGLLGAGVDLDAGSAMVRAETRLELGRALAVLGDLDVARARAGESLALAIEADDKRLTSQARILQLDIAISSGQLVEVESAAVELADVAIREAEGSGDHVALTVAYQSRAQLAHMAGDAGESSRLTAIALEHAQASPDRSLGLEIEVALLADAVVDWTPASAVVPIMERLVLAARDYPSIRADALRLGSVAEAMLGRFDDARAHSDECLRTFEDLGMREGRWLALGDRTWIERLAGDPVAAEEAIRSVIRDATAVGHRSLASWAAGRLLSLLVEDGRLVDAAPILDLAANVLIVMNRTRVMGARARIAATEGDAAAPELISTLLAAVHEVQYPNVQIDGYLDAAGASASLGDHAAARRYAEEALRIAAAKGNVVRAGQVQQLLEGLHREPRSATRAVGGEPTALR